MVGRYRSLRSIKTRDVSTGVFHTDRVYTLHKLYKSKLELALLRVPERLS